MGFYDRHYYQEQRSGLFQGAKRFLFPFVPPVVRWLLIVNLLVFIPTHISQKAQTFIFEYFGVYPKSHWYMIQVWRFISYQFLHDGWFHILFNMFALYMFGPTIEQIWGSRRFAIFYISCGAMGGILYTLLVLFRFLDSGVMIGASGAICGILAASAVLFPNMRILFLAMIPLSMRTLAIILLGISILNFLAGQNAGGEAAHLAGMAVGALYVVWRPWMDKIRFKPAKTQWEKNLERERRFRFDVDRILDKVHANGIQSLTWREKRILKKATQREQQSHKS
jgi:membrane associated rhomboid family serine protease